MKTKTLFPILVAVLLVSCAPAALNASPTKTEVLLSTFTPLPATEELLPTEMLVPTSMISSTFTPNPTAEMPISISTSTVGFAEPDPETWVMLMPAVREYFYYRKKAVIAGSAEVLWARYPELKDGADFSNHINAEAFFINNMQGLKPFDGDIFSESYEKIKVKMLGDWAEVLTHGMELYLYADETGKFDNSGSEFKIILFLRRQEKQWTVYKTHDISGP